MTQPIPSPFRALILAAGLVAVAAVQADPAFDSALLDVERQWDHCMYEVPPGAQAAAFAKLDASTKSLVDRYPDRVEPLLWEAISLSGHAKAQGGLGALSMAKQARDLLVKAEGMDPKALSDGSVYASLGALYAKVPGWPIGFGDKTKAEEYLKKALAQNPTGIDQNYLYGDFLFDQGRYKEAEQYLERALKSPPRPGRLLGDRGRTQEVHALLDQVRSKLALAGGTQARG